MPFSTPLKWLAAALALTLAAGVPARPQDDDAPGQRGRRIEQAPRERPAPQAAPMAPMSPPARMEAPRDDGWRNAPRERQAAPVMPAAPPAPPPRMESGGRPDTWGAAAQERPRPMPGRVEPFSERGERPERVERLERSERAEPGRGRDEPGRGALQERGPSPAAAQPGASLRATPPGQAVQVESAPRGVGRPSGGPVTSGSEVPVLRSPGNTRPVVVPRAIVRPALPAYATVTVYGGERYWFADGYWYVTGAGGYVIARPPVGLYISVLPVGYSIYHWGGYSYYHYGGVYYTQVAGSGYQVVEPPPEMLAASTEPLMVYPAAGQSPETQRLDEFECHLWSVERSGFDPTLVAIGQQPPGTQAQRGNYARGMSACLSGRGYSVR